MGSISSSITVDGSFFDYNTATFGGALLGYSRSSITVENSSFGGNTAENDGGVLPRCMHTLILSLSSKTTVNLSITQPRKEELPTSIVVIYKRSAICILITKQVLMEELFS